MTHNVLSLPLKDELKDMIDDLQIRLRNSENGEIIQFNEQRETESMHQELAQSDEYLRSLEEEIQQLKQELDLKNNIISELNGT